MQQRRLDRAGVQVQIRQDARDRNGVCDVVVAGLALLSLVSCGGGFVRVQDAC